MSAPELHPAILVYRAERAKRAARFAAERADLMRRVAARLAREAEDQRAHVLYLRRTAGERQGARPISQVMFPMGAAGQLARERNAAKCAWRPSNIPRVEAMDNRCGICGERPPKTLGRCNPCDRYRRRTGTERVTDTADARRRTA